MPFVYAGGMPHVLAAAVLVGLGLGSISSVAEAGSGEGSLELITLNTWGLPPPVSADRRDRFSDINHFVEESGVDLVALEEVWHGAVRLLSLDGLRRPRAQGDHGLAVVTRHALDAIEFQAFKAERGYDALKTKGVLRARVAFPTGLTDVFVTHMQAGGGDHNATVRRLQMEQILSAVAESALPAVVMGDFNLHLTNAIDLETWSMALRSGWVDVAASLGKEEPTFAGSNHRFDHVYLRDDRSRPMTPEASEVLRYDDDPATANPPWLSDHLPLKVRVRVETD